MGAIGPLALGCFGLGCMTLEEFQRAYHSEAPAWNAFGLPGAHFTIKQVIDSFPPAPNTQQSNMPESA